MCKLGFFMKSACLTLLFLAMQSAYAIGPEDVEFVGKIGHEKFYLGWRGVVLDNPPGAYAGTYGNEMREFSVCNVEGSKLSCSDKMGEQPNVVYILGDNSNSAQFKTAINLYKEFYPEMKINKRNSEGVYFFVCQKGCSAAVPPLLIMVSHGD